MPKKHPSGQSGDASCSTEFAPRQVIEDQLLVALDDKSKVAIVASEDDLKLLIHALRRVPEGGPSWRACAHLRSDLEQLLRAAFPAASSRETATDGEDEPAASESRRYVDEIRKCVLAIESIYPSIGRAMYDEPRERLTHRINTLLHGILAEEWQASKYGHIALAFRKLRDYWFDSVLLQRPTDREDEAQIDRRERHNADMKARYDADTDAILRGETRPVSPRSGKELSHIVVGFDAT